jgi:predicted nucleic acid-binding protein
LRIYADTSFLGSLYIPDANASIALRKLEEIQNDENVFPVSALLVLEVHNAIRLAVFRRYFTSADADHAAATFDADINAQFFHKTALPPDIWKTADELSRLHTGNTGCRSLDILQVAFGLLLKVDQFLTFDKRQRKLALAAGLDAPDLLASYS